MVCRQLSKCWPQETEVSAILRDWPYPYRAALTISNDADWMQWQTFLDIHSYLNTDRDTPLGKGLDLEISDSFFPFTEDEGREFSYFSGYEGKKSKYASQIRELVQAGYIDTLHTYGDFDQGICFKRKMADIAINEFMKQDMRLEVWTNHGTVNNIQNIGGSTGYYQHGDLRDSSAYHTDLSIQYGIKHYWNDTVLTTRFALPKREPNFFPNLLGGHPRLFLINKVLARILSSRLGCAVLPAMSGRGLCSIHVLRDASKIWNFVRFRFTTMLAYAPHARSLHLQLTDVNLKQLIKKRSVAIIYQHLGIMRDDKGRITNNPLPYFTSEQIQCLKRIEQLAIAGTLFVTGLRRLLNYINVSNYVDYDVIGSNGWEYIVIRGVKCPLAGWREAKEEEVQGLTFYTAHPERTKLCLGHQSVFLRQQNNDADESGRKSVSVRWVKAEWPF